MWVFGDEMMMTFCCQSEYVFLDVSIDSAPVGKLVFEVRSHKLN